MLRVGIRPGCTRVLSALCARAASSKPTIDQQIEEMNAEMAELFGAPSSAGVDDSPGFTVEQPDTAATLGRAEPRPAPAASEPEADVRVRQILHAKIRFFAEQLERTEDVARCSELARCISDVGHAASAVGVPFGPCQN